MADTANHVTVSASLTSQFTPSISNPRFYPFLQWLDMQHQESGQLKSLRHFFNNIRLGQWEVARAQLRNMDQAVVLELLQGILVHPDAVARYL